MHVLSLTLTIEYQNPASGATPEASPMLGSDWPAKTSLSYRVACLGYLGYLIAATKLDQCKGNPWVEGVKAGPTLSTFYSGGLAWS